MSIAHLFSLLYFTGVAQIPSFMPSGGRLVDIEETFGCSTIRKDYKYNVKLKSNQMLVYKLCYDKSMNIPTHSSHTLQTPVHEQIFRISYSNQKFSKNLIATPEDFYQCSSQIENFSILLDSRTQSTKLINCNAGYYYVPSSLVPASDFNLEQYRRATQFYFNTFPQWRQIKEGNWNNLEKSIRNYANLLGYELEIRSGTLKTATLPHIGGQEQPVYMTRDNDGTPTVEIPRLVWKLVYNRRNYESIVFVSVNNPYRTSTQDLFKYGEVLCYCVCDQTEGWFEGWNREVFAQGYIYCCTGDEFRASTGMNIAPGTRLMRKKR